MPGPVFVLAPGSVVLADGTEVAVPVPVPLATVEEVAELAAGGTDVDVAAATEEVVAAAVPGRHCE